MMRRNWLAIVTLALLTSGGALGATTSASAASGAFSERIQLAYSPLIRDIQAALNSLGYTAGPIDGLMGTRTRSAINAYQRDNGLLVTGQPSAVLLDHIEATLADRGTPEPAAPDSDLVAQIQSQLRQRGYPIAIVDGRLNAETELAIRSYERASGLAVTGLPSSALLAHLENRNGDDQADGRTYADRVRFAQSRLNSLGYEAGPADGVMGPRTESALLAYQRDSGLPVTDQLNREVLAALRRDTRRESRDERDTPTFADHVRIVQQELNARGYDAGPADGVLGPKTRDAIRTYQSDADEPVTGQVTASLVARLQGDTTTGPQPPDPDEPQPTGWTDKLDDNFRDGNYTSNPRWTVHAGRFSVRRGALESQVASAGPESLLGGSDGNLSPAEQLGRTLVTGFLESLIAGGSGQARSTAAEISTGFPLENRFRMRLRVSLGSPDGEFAFGPYQNWNRRSGYRLAYDGRAGTLSLVSVTRQGARVIASRSGLSRLADGNPHDIDLRRSADGRMVALVDGQHVLETRNNTYRDAFDGLVFVNLHGTVRLHRARVQDQT